MNILFINHVSLFSVAVQYCMRWFINRRSDYGKYVDVRTGLPKKPRFTAVMQETVDLWSFLEKFMKENLQHTVCGSR